MTKIKKTIPVQIEVNGNSCGLLYGWHCKFLDERDCGCNFFKIDLERDKMMLSTSSPSFLKTNNILRCPECLELFGMPEEVTLGEIIIKYLTDNGYHGLANEEIDCSCELGDLIPCGDCNFEDCRPAKFKYCKDCKSNGQCAIQDEYACDHCWSMPEEEK